MNFFSELRQKFDMWRRDRLDRKLLRIRQRYEDPTEYEIVFSEPDPVDPETQWKEDSALFTKRFDTDARSFEPRSLPPIFKANEVIGAHQGFDAKKHNEACQLVYGPLEYQHEQLIKSLRNDRGDPFENEPRIIRPELTTTKVSIDSGRVKDTDTNPLQGEN